LMRSGDHKASAVDRACTDAVEAAVMRSHVGETFDASVVDAERKNFVVVQLSDPAVVDRARGTAELGAAVRVRVDSAEVAASSVQLSLV
ncbi:MAG: RNB domain-containing ribonuclease, partial [Lapillicoccus sp.]